jgi:hypothetical protein
LLALFFGYVFATFKFAGVNTMNVAGELRKENLCQQRVASSFKEQFSAPALFEMVIALTNIAAPPHNVRERNRLVRSFLSGYLPPFDGEKQTRAV